MPITRFKISKNLNQILILLILFTGYMLSDFYYRKIRNIKNKEALKKIQHHLGVGDDSNKVKKIYNLYNTGKLELVTESEQIWRIMMPFEWGANDWILWIEFEDNKIIALKIRLSDSVYCRPDDSPDKTRRN
ncbi:MAG: hypothetical protein HY781_07625 [Chloroflexi bacterium]|nr:hypothetical protein [Chloroflexota bacterium]